MITILNIFGDNDNNQMIINYCYEEIKILLLVFYDNNCELLLQFRIKLFLHVNGINNKYIW